jgi:hypothetical protein
LPMMRIASFAILACLFARQQLAAVDKEGLLSKYRGKYVVVVGEGLSTCTQVGHFRQKSSSANEGEAGMSIFINERGGIEPKRELSGCHVEPMHKSEVLKVAWVSFVKGYLYIRLLNLSPHAVTVGAGALAHESAEMGGVNIVVWTNNGKDLDKADALAAQWIKPFDSATDAAAFGNTSSGVFVKEVKVGMSFAEVEKVLGVPQTRVDLGEKVLYKYKDMTIEFQNGKVRDVR